MVKNYEAISAEQAKAMADTSLYTIRHIYKEIRHAASENATKLYWCFTYTSRAVLDTIVDELESQGYLVEKIFNEDVCEAILISW